VQVKRDVATTSADQLIYGTTVPNVAQVQLAPVQAVAYLAEPGGRPGPTGAGCDALRIRAQIEYTRSIELARTGIDARYFGPRSLQPVRPEAALVDQRRDSARGSRIRARYVGRATGCRGSRSPTASRRSWSRVVVLLASVAVAVQSTPDGDDAPVFEEAPRCERSRRR